MRHDLMSFDVMIAGGNYVGLALALALAQAVPGHLFDLYFAASRLEDPDISGQIEARFSERARAEPLIRTLRFNFVVAP